MILGVPITNHNGDIPIWGGERNRNYSSVVYNKTAIPACCSLKIERREVKEAPNLILDLKLVGPIPFWWNRTVCAQNTILP